MKGINATTGIFATRDELEKRVIRLFRQKLATTVISQRCGISGTTVRLIIKEFKDRNTEINQ